MSDVSQIDGSAVRLSREAQGWAINDLAARACLSVKQVRQIEEGGLSSFYSESVKLTAARKVASLLQMSEAQLFGQVPLHTPQVEESLLFAAHTEPVLRTESAEPAGALSSHGSSGVHLSRSEALHFLAQPPEMDWPATPASHEAPDMESPVALAPQPADHAAKVTTDSAHVEIEPVASGNYFLKILVLFLVAIAVAALLRPKPSEPTQTAPEASSGQSMTLPPQPATAETATAATPVVSPSNETSPNASESKPLSAAEPAAPTPSTAAAPGAAALQPAVTPANKP